VEKKENVAGALFFDMENNVDDWAENTVIYGHNMRNGSMFHDLRYYAGKDFFEAHKYVNLVTLYDDTWWEIFAFLKTGTDFYYIQANFPQKQLFQAFIDEIKLKATYDTGIEVTADDKLLTLSTCSNQTDDSRYVVFAKLLPGKPDVLPAQTL